MYLCKITLTRDCEFDICTSAFSCLFSVAIIRLIRLLIIVCNTLLLYIYLFCCIDDILIFFSKEEHFRHLTVVFEGLKYYGLILNRKKYIFLQYLKSTSFAIESAKKGVAPLEDKVTAIRKFLRPRTMKGLRRFLEMVSFYRHFIHGFAKTLAPLHSLL